jgi:tetratricopeptide (TPR) repeat protein
MVVLPHSNRVSQAIGMLLLVTLSGNAQSDVLGDAVSALEAGHANEAEQLLRRELHRQPANGDALALLAVVLDKEGKFAEASDAYRRAIVLEPRSAPLRNNFGNHLLLQERFGEAEREFLRVLDLDPANTNARLQVARIELRQNAPGKALTSLTTLPADVQNRPDVLLLRMQALYKLGKRAEADAIYDRLSRESQASVEQSLALGSALFGAEEYKAAEQIFARASSLAPDRFDAIYYRGLSASRSGAYAAASEYLQQAIRLQPTNTRAVYDLAVVNAKLGNRDRAVQLLGQAARLSPERAEIPQLLARLTAELGYFADSLAAWDRYLQLVPRDESAKRERAFVQTALESQSAEGFRALGAYVRSHPKDAIGHYELGTAECATDPDAALRELNRALALAPDLTPARFARALLHQRQGRTQLALVDFQAATKRLPDDAIALDRLGETQLELNQTAAAVPTLQKAAKLAPENVTVLTHLGRALQKSGNAEEARAVFARVRELGPVRPEPARPAGLLDFLSLSPEEQLARYRAGLEASLKKNPGNAQAQLQYMQLLLEDGQTDHALGVAHKLAALKPAPALARQAESALVAVEQYDAAKEFRADTSAQRNE